MSASKRAYDLHEINCLSMSSSSVVTAKWQRTGGRETGGLTSSGTGKKLRSGSIGRLDRGEAGYDRVRKMCLGMRERRVQPQQAPPGYGEGEICGGKEELQYGDDALFHKGGLLLPKGPGLITNLTK
jgi:hypothetical protein